MQFNEFKMIVQEAFETARANINRWSIYTSDAAKRDSADYLWACEELIRYVKDEVPISGDTELYKYIDAVVGFTYQMDLFSRVNPAKRKMFENARSVGGEIEDVLNAML